MVNSLRENGDGHRSEIEHAVAELNMQEQQKPPNERRVFTALSPNVESSVFRSFNGQGGMVNWYVIAGDERGLWFAAAPIQLKGGIGLEMNRMRVFSRSEMEQELLVSERGSMSDALGAALSRLAGSHESASAAHNIDHQRRQFAVRLCNTLLDCITEGPHIEVHIYEGMGQPPRRLVRDMMSRDVITIGRNFNRDIVMMASNISREHAEIQYADGHWSARDNFSRNGTRVGDQVLGHDWTRVT